jgi:hypothetical protein
MKRAIIVPALVTAFVALSPVGVALADNPHSPANPHGQPNQSAEDQIAAGGTQPAGFNTGGFANAQTHYAAGTEQGKNPKAVSQYDVAAFQLSNNHGHTK